MSQAKFYQSLSSFTDLAQLAQAQHYASVPEDWLIFLTDVKGSTKAIAEGRYKDVNTVGAACIISAQNALSGMDFPFVFGGDGASLVVPPEFEQKVVSALAFVRKKSREQFQLDLRIAKVPVSEVKKAGANLMVAKYEMSPGNFIAMFAGGGLSKAEKLMKDESKTHTIGENVTAEGDIQGLECRWNPVPSQQDGMLSIIIKANDNFSEAQQAQVYTELLNEIHQIAPQTQPIQFSNLPVTWPPQFLLAEAKFKTSNYFLQRLRVALVAVYAGILTLLVKALKDKPGSPAAVYMNQLSQNTDYLKIDDHLRMIIDVSLAQKEKIHEILNRLQIEKGVFSGTYFSSQALMTCFVQAGSKHVHFVDGSDGGYALAAKDLKEKLVRTGGFEPPTT